MLDGFWIVGPFLPRTPSDTENKACMHPSLHALHGLGYILEKLCQQGCHSKPIISWHTCARLIPIALCRSKAT